MKMCPVVSAGHVVVGEREKEMEKQKKIVIGICDDYDIYVHQILSKSGVKKALGVHYCTSKASGAGTVYGYTKLERNKKSTY